MKITCTRRIQFCSGHRVFGHENKCSSLHGHNYVALIEAESESLDSIGRVVDFSVLKDLVGGWIEETWDHALVLHAEDPLVEQLQRIKYEGKIALVHKNPTVENMAAILFDVSNELLLHGTGVRVASIRLWETENCYADARGSQ